MIIFPFSNPLCWGVQTHKNWWRIPFPAHKEDRELSLQSRASLDWRIPIEIPTDFLFLDKKSLNTWDTLNLSFSKNNYVTQKRSSIKPTKYLNPWTLVVWHKPQTFECIKAKGLELLLLPLDGKDNLWYLLGSHDAHSTLFDNFEDSLKECIYSKKHNSIYNAIGDE